ncbi:MAG: response regulator [Pseudomonadota bacterium]
MRALVIEDQSLFATMVEEELRELGYDEVEVVATEREAIASATKICPDLITADHRLSSGTGVEAIRVICSDKRIPFVFITSYPEEVRKELPSAVMLSKPFWPPKLKAAIAHAIGVSRMGTDLPGPLEDRDKSN